MESLRISEFDDANNLTATYVQSRSEAEGGSRVDVIPPEQLKTAWQQILDVFLPAGYPHSVTQDYMEYQIYDSIQAFASSIAGLLASRAVLSSVGVGDSSASPTAALLLSIFQESAGRVATILFAHRFGTALEPECKLYRLLADVLNDLAFLLDYISPIFPRFLRVPILAASSVLRALCGVAAGSAKASLSAHFARGGHNLGELNAKDSSQETVISLAGMLVGTVVVSEVRGGIATLLTLLLLLAVHLEANRRAVRAVCLRSLNRQRASLLFHHLQAGRVPTPEEIAVEERIFEEDGALRSRDGRIVGYCTLGAPMSQLLAYYAKQHSPIMRSVRLDDRALDQLFNAYKSKAYVIWYEKKPRVGEIRFNVLLKQTAMPRDVLLAWWEVLSIACAADAYQTEVKELVPAAALLRQHEEAVLEKGWELNSNSLETTSTLRIQLSNEAS